MGCCLWGCTESDTTEATQQQQQQQQGVYRNGHLCLAGSQPGLCGSLLVIIRGLWARLQRGSVSFGGDLGSGLCFCGLGARLNKKKGTDAARISILAA